MKGGLLEKLVRVSQAVGALKKDGYNAHHKFKFVTHDAVVDAVRTALADNGVDFRPDIESITHEGKSYLVQVIYTFTCKDTGETQACRWFGEGQDSQDKGAYKAITQAKKTFLLNKFLIPTGEQYADGDFGQGYEEPQRQAAPARQKAAAAKPKPEQPQKVWADLSTKQQQHFAIKRKELAEQIAWGDKYPNGYTDWIKTADYLTNDPKTNEPSFAASYVHQVEKVLQALELLSKRAPKTTAKEAT